MGLDNVVHHRHKGDADARSACAGMQKARGSVQECARAFAFLRAAWPQNTPAHRELRNHLHFFVCGTQTGPTRMTRVYPPRRALVCVACATRAGPWITLNLLGLHL